MDSLPLTFSLRGRKVLLAGHGEAAQAKARLLVRTPAEIVWFGPAADEIDDPQIASERLTFAERDVRDSDFAGAALAVIANGDDAEDRRLAGLARAAHIPVNVVDRPELSDFSVPAIVDRSPVLVAISTEGTAPVLARRIRAMLEAALPLTTGRLAARAGAFRERLKTWLPDFSARRRVWERVFSAEDPAALADLDEESFGARLEALADEEATGARHGLVQLVGAGPGDPELLTLKAQRALQSADVIVYDRLVSEGVLDYARRDAEFVFVGKRRGDHGRGQAYIHSLLVHHARAGRRVVRLKAGDPFVFGRAGEEIAALREAGAAVEVVPGITALAGCAATAQIPLTHRDHASAVTLVTGHVQAGSELDWRALAGADRTLAVYMGVSTAGEIAATLLEDGVAGTTPVAVLENGTCPEERRLYGRLAELPELVDREHVSSPALILIGQVAAEARDWPEDKGLSDIAAIAEPMALAG